MEPIIVETQPTADRNVATIQARMANFTFAGPHRGIQMYVEYLNQNNIIMDAAWVAIDGTDWQNWPCGLSEAEDHEYIGNILLNKLGLTKRLKAPYFVQYPNSQSVIEGGKAIFAATVKGNPDVFTYQWYKEDSIIPNATGNNYEIDNVDNSKTGIYSILVSNTQGLLSGSAYLSSIPLSIPTIKTQPVNTQIVSGRFGQLFVVADGVPTAEYQWFKDSTLISGQSAASIYFNSIQTSDTGIYTVNVYNSQGSVISDPAVLTIIDSPEYYGCDSTTGNCVI